MALRDRILATIAAAEKRLALAEAATPGPWTPSAEGVWADIDDALIADAWIDRDENAAHIAANNPTTVAAEQRRIIAAGHADLALYDYLDACRRQGVRDGVVFDNLTARYP